MKISERKQNGSMSLYIAAVVLPLLFFLFSLSVDVGAYVTETQAVQKIADETSLYGSRFLPSAAEAKNAVESYLTARGVSIVEQGQDAPETSLRAARVLITPDSVSLDVSAKVPMSFAGLFLRMIGQDPEQEFISTSARAVSRATPLDVLIAMDASSYLAPDIPIGTPWGSAVDWPSAEYFDSQDIRTAGVAVDKKLLTQQCFNQGFSSLKRSVLNAYEQLSSFRRNAVGISFFPAIGRPVFKSRSIRPFIPAVDIGSTGEASFQLYNSRILAAGPYASDEWCAASAEIETLNEDYNFPSENSDLREISRPSAPSTMISPATGKFDPLYSMYLEAREVVWSKAVSSASTGNFIELLRSIQSQLVGSQAVQARGGLAAHVEKSAIVFLGDLPYGFANVQYPAASVSNGIQVELEALREQVFTYGFSLSLLVIGFNHPGNSSRFSSQGNSLKNFLEGFSEVSRPNQGGRFKVHFLYGDDVSHMGRQASAAVLASQRTSMLVE